MGSTKKKTAIESLDDDDDEYLSKKTINRRENQKLMDGITSTLYRLELESIKPSFDVLLTSGVHRGLYLNRRRRALAAKRVQDNELKLDSATRQSHRLPADSSLLRYLTEPTKKDEGPQRTEVIDEWQIPTSGTRRRGVSAAKYKPEVELDRSSTTKYATLPRQWKPTPTSAHKELTRPSSNKPLPKREATPRFDYGILTLNDLPWRDMRADPEYSYIADEIPVQYVPHTPKNPPLASEHHSHSTAKFATSQTQRKHIGTHGELPTSTDKSRPRREKTSHFETGILTLNDLPWRDMRADPEYSYIAEEEQVPVQYVSYSQTNPPLVSGRHSSQTKYATLPRQWKHSTAQGQHHPPTDKPRPRRETASHFDTGILTLNDLPWREMRADPEHYYLSEVDETPVHHVSQTQTNPTDRHTIDGPSSRNVFEEDQLMSYLPKPASKEEFSLDSIVDHAKETPKVKIPETHIEQRDYGYLEDMLNNTFTRRHQLRNYQSVDVLPTTADYNYLPYEPPTIITRPTMKHTLWNP